MANLIHPTTSNVCSALPLFGVSEFRPWQQPQLLQQQQPWQQQPMVMTQSSPVLFGDMNHNPLSPSSVAPPPTISPFLNAEFFQPAPLAAPVLEDVPMHAAPQQQYYNLMPSNAYIQQQQMFGAPAPQDVQMNSAQNWNPPMYDQTFEMQQAPEQIKPLAYMQQQVPEPINFDYNQMLLNKQAEQALFEQQQQIQLIQQQHQLHQQQQQQQNVAMPSLVEPDFDTNMLAKSNYGAHDSFPTENQACLQGMPISNGGSFDFMQQSPLDVIVPQQPAYVPNPEPLQLQPQPVVVQQQPQEYVMPQLNSGPSPAPIPATFMGLPVVQTPPVLEQQQSPVPEQQPIAMMSMAAQQQQQQPQAIMQLPLSDPLSGLLPSLDESRSIRRRGKKRKKPPTTCLECGVGETPEWRRGPQGPRTLCNACGLRYAKRKKRKAQQSDKEVINQLTQQTGALNVVGMPNLNGSPQTSPSTSPVPMMSHSLHNSAPNFRIPNMLDTELSVISEPLRLSPEHIMMASPSTSPLPTNPPLANATPVTTKAPEVVIGASPTLMELINNNRLNSEILANALTAVKSGNGFVSLAGQPSVPSRPAKKLFSPIARAGSAGSPITVSDIKPEHAFNTSLHLVAPSLQVA